MRADFILVLVGLALMTAGVCLIMASWSTPAINSSVNWVRLLGPVVFCAGFVSLIASCFACAIQQRLCCRSCRQRTEDFDKDTPAPSSGRLRKQVSANGSRSTDSDDRCIADGRSDVNSTPDRTKTHLIASHFDDVKFPVVLASTCATTSRSAFRSEPSILASRIIACQTGCCAAKTQQNGRNIPGYWRGKSNEIPETALVDNGRQHSPHCTASQLRCSDCNPKTAIARTSSCPASSINRLMFPKNCRDVVTCYQTNDHLSRDYQCASAGSEDGEESQTAVECEHCVAADRIQQTNVTRNNIMSTYMTRRPV